MDWEKQLVSRVARDKSVEKLIVAGIESKHFEHIEDKPSQGCLVFETMIDHFHTWNGAPSFEVVSEAHPNYEFIDPSDNTDFIISQFLKNVKRRETTRILSQVAQKISGPESEAYLQSIDEYVLAAARELAETLPKATSKRFSGMKDRVKQYEAVYDFGPAMGIPYPFPTVNTFMHGIQKHEVVTISGWSGTGKSYLGLLMCYNAYMAGKTPLIISLEMGADAINRRLDVMATNLSHTAMRKAEIDKPGREKWEKIADKVQTERKEHDIIILDSLNHCTSDKVYAETIRYKPDLVMIDYLTLMDGPRGFKGPQWEKVSEISRRLKSQAQGLQIPILSIAQTNRAGATDGARDDNIASSIGILQDSDVLFGLHQNKEMRENKQMELRLLKNRDGAIRDFAIYWDVDSGNFREWKLTDII